jgi:hypothetical protein
MPAKNSRQLFFAGILFFGFANIYDKWKLQTCQQDQDYLTSAILWGDVGLSAASNLRAGLRSHGLNRSVAC